jgi:hypothetical protein
LGIAAGETGDKAESNAVWVNGGTPLSGGQPSAIVFDITEDMRISGEMIRYVKAEHRAEKYPWREA